jgi:hypothetical protein
LDGTYEQALRTIDKQKRDFAHRLFQCLAVSKRPVRVEELAELFAIQLNDEGATPTFDARLRPEKPEEFVLFVLSDYPTLVAVVNVDGEKIVRFSHFSVREYLTSDRIAISQRVSHFHVLPRSAHVLLARACLSVLLHLADHVGTDNIQDFPLASYAAQNWVDHAQFEDVTSDIRHEMECLFDKNKPYFAAWLWLYNLDDSSERFKTAVQNVRPYPVPLYYAALCGFRDIAERLIDAHPQDINAWGGERVTPLHAAVEKGHLTVATLLLDHGADVESRNSQSRTPLHVATYWGHAEVVSLLIDRGADPNAEDTNRDTPLHLASRRGHHDMIRLLVDRGADVNRPYRRGWTPLHVASTRGDRETVRLLLDLGADADHKDSCGRTPLHHALMRGDNDTAVLLLDHAVDDDYSETDTAV